MSDTLHSGVTAAPDSDLVTQLEALAKLADNAKFWSLSKLLREALAALREAEQHRIDADNKTLADAIQINDMKADRASWRRVAEGLQRDLTAAEAELARLREERDAMEQELRRRRRDAAQCLHDRLQTRTL